MKAAHVLILLTFFLFGSVSAQQNQRDSLIRALQNARDDTTRVNMLNTLARYYNYSRQDSAIYFSTQAIELAEKIGYSEGSFSGYARLAFVLNTSSNYSGAMEMAIHSLKI